MLTPCRRRTEMFCSTRLANIPAEKENVSLVHDKSFIDNYVFLEFLLKSSSQNWQKMTSGIFPLINYVIFFNNVTLCKYVDE